MSFKDFTNFDERAYNKYEKDGLDSAALTQQLTAQDTLIAQQLQQIAEQNLTIDTPFKNQGTEIGSLLKTFSTALSMVHSNSDSSLELLLIKMRFNDLLFFNNQYYQACLKGDLRGKDKQNFLAMFIEILNFHSRPITDILGILCDQCLGSGSRNAIRKRLKITACNTQFVPFLTATVNNVRSIMNMPPSPAPVMRTVTLATSPQKRRRIEKQESPVSSIPDEAGYETSVDMNTPSTNRNSTTTSSNSSTSKSTTLSTATPSSIASPPEITSPSQSDLGEPDELKEDKENDFDESRVASSAPATRSSTALVVSKTNAATSPSLSMSVASQPIISSPSRSLISQSFASVIQPYLDKEQSQPKSAFSAARKAVKDEPLAKTAANLTFWGIACALGAYVLPYSPLIWGFATTTIWGGVVTALAFVALVGVVYFSSKFLPAFFNRYLGRFFNTTNGDAAEKEVGQAIQRIEISITRLGAEPRIYNQYVNNVKNVQQNIVVKQESKQPQETFMSPQPRQRVQMGQNPNSTQALFSQRQRSHSSPDFRGTPEAETPSRVLDFTSPASTNRRK